MKVIRESYLEISAETEERIVSSIVNFINRPPPPIFYVVPSWCERNQKYAYHGKFIQGRDRNGVIRCKILRANENAPGWFVQLSQILCEKNIEGWLPVKLSFNSHPSVAVITPAYSDPQRTITAGDNRIKELAASEPPQFSQCQTADEFCARFITNSMKEARLFPQTKNLAPGSGQQVWAAVSMANNLRVFVVDEQIWDLKDELIGAPETAWRDAARRFMKILAVEDRPEITSRLTF